MVSPALLTVYKEQVATRALQLLLSSRVMSTVKKAGLFPGASVLYCYHTSNNTDTVEWREGTVVSAETHRVRINTTAGISSSVAYEDICLLPASTLTRSLTERSVEDKIAPGEYGNITPLPTPAHDLLAAEHQADTVINEGYFASAQPLTEDTRQSQLCRRTYEAEHPTLLPT